MEDKLLEHKTTTKVSLKIMSCHSLGGKMFYPIILCYNQLVTISRCDLKCSLC